MQSTGLKWTLATRVTSHLRIFWGWIIEEDRMDPGLSYMYPCFRGWITVEHRIDRGFSSISFSFLWGELGRKTGWTLEFPIRVSISWGVNYEGRQDGPWIFFYWIYIQFVVGELWRRAGWTLDFPLLNIYPICCGWIMEKDRMDPGFSSAWILSFRFHWTLYHCSSPASSKKIRFT